MSLINDASLILTPNSVKEGKLYSIIPSNGNGDMTVVRATTATRVNSSGLVESVAANVPRLNYDSVGGCPSILVEPQRTNLFTYSEEFNNASWNKTRVTISPNVTTAPNGTMTADKLIEDTAIGNHNTQQPIIPANQGFYTFSCFIKKSERTWIVLLISTGTGECLVWYNVDNGTIGTITNGTGSSSTTATIENIGDGWYRCSMTINKTSTTTGTLGLFLSTGNNIVSYTGNGSSGLFIWGAQLEVGAYPTSYIPTTTATTRNADVITRNNIYTNNLITSLGGTWFVELNNNLSLTRDISGNGIWIGDTNTSSTAGNSLNIRHNGGTARLTINKTVANVLTPLYFTLTNTVKIAIDWNGTTADVFVNGVKVLTATSFTTTNMEFLNNSANDVPKYIKSMMLFPSPLTDAECIALTTL